MEEEGVSSSLALKKKKKKKERVLEDELAAEPEPIVEDDGL